MSIKVQELMVDKVISIEPEISVLHAARLMNRFDVSSLLVVSKGQILGIITIKDIINRVVCANQNPVNVPIGSVMTFPIIVIGPDETIETAVKLMVSNKISKLPVVQNEKEELHLLGIISLFDVARVHPEIVNSIVEPNELKVDATPLFIS
jgi:CBS domain-containing protein